MTKDKNERTSKTRSTNLKRVRLEKVSLVLVIHWIVLLSLLDFEKRPISVVSTAWIQTKLDDGVHT